MSASTTGQSTFYGANRNPFNYEKIEQIDRDLSTQWLTLDEITQQLNLFMDESQDSYLSSLELATRMAIEDYLGLTIFPVTYRCYYGQVNSFNNDVALDLPEVSETGVTINEVAYYTTNPNPVRNVLASSNYFYDQTGNRVVITSFPNVENPTMANPVEVIYQTNPSIIAQYPVVKQAGLMLLTSLYNNRDTVSDTVGAKSQVPFGVATLLRPYKPLVM